MPRTPKAPVPASLRWEVWERDDFRCHYCGSRRFLALDHVRPESRGGPTGAGNLRTACGRCNSAKGARDAEDVAWGLWLRAAEERPQPPEYAALWDDVLS